MAEKTRLRLDRALAQIGLGTRKEVRALIKKGRVAVDGEIITDHGFILTNPGEAAVTLDDMLLTLRKHTHLMLNKPAGYVSAHKDNRFPVILELIAPELRYRSLTSVGRLDRDTTGLILMTTDGELAHRLMSPKYQIVKTYHIIYAGRPFSEADREQFRLGIMLEDKTVCLPAELEILDESDVLLSIKEGKYHQVKRMLEATGRKVTYLSRLSIGELTLDPELDIGEYRLLTEEEISGLYASVKLELEEY
ncbi:MAG TPA: 16S rRNA pseudouridine(516) synthase [Clostridiaceae bacterium]|nr:16S rRNA pseudouridine(516) synthase [Clostridiaceae bacterium]